MNGDYLPPSQPPVAVRHSYPVSGPTSNRRDEAMRQEQSPSGSAVSRRS